MPLPSDLPIVDHHCHLSPAGDNIAAVRRFQTAGGTHLFLTTQNYGQFAPLSLDAYREQFETTIRLGQKVREETGVVAYSVLAPYPVDLVTGIEKLGLSKAQDLHRSALDLAGKYVSEGMAVAIGEVGRPHFPTKADTVEAASSLFSHALEVARDAGCPAVVHCEDLDSAGYRAMAEVASRVSFPLDRLVKHYARSALPGEVAGTIVPSYLAKTDLIRKVIRDPPPWFLETDYLDDPRRPGAVLDLATVPRRAHQVARLDPANLEHLRVPFEHSVKLVYGLTLTADRPVRS